MPRKTANSRPKMSGRTRVASKDEPTSHWRTTLILTLSILTLVGLVGWIVCSEANAWRDWLGGLRAKRPSFDSADNGEAGDNPTQFRGDGYAALGEFLVDRRENDETMLTVCFQLSGQTICKDEESFRAFTDKNYPAFRGHVEGAIRDCEFSALADEESLGRKVKVRVNRLLGRHFLQSVEFDELTIYETIGSYEPTIWKPMKKTER
jgi:hypothetical protein